MLRVWTQLYNCYSIILYDSTVHKIIHNSYRNHRGANIGYNKLTRQYIFKEINIPWDNQLAILKIL